MFCCSDVKLAQSQFGRWFYRSLAFSYSCTGVCTLSVLLQMYFILSFMYVFPWSNQKRFIIFISSTSFFSFLFKLLLSFLTVYSIVYRTVQTSHSSISCCLLFFYYFMLYPYPYRQVHVMLFWKDLFLAYVFFRCWIFFGWKRG